MNDRTWLLKNSDALSCANKCISIIRKEVGTKISLSDQQLIQKIGAMSQSIGSIELRVGFKLLLDYAGVQEADVATEQEESQPAKETAMQSAGRLISEKIEFKGKQYPRFDEQGREFKGIYRGNANYA